MTKMALVLAILELSLTSTFDITRPHGENSGFVNDSVLMAGVAPRKARLNFCVNRTILIRISIYNARS